MCVCEREGERERERENRFPHNRVACKMRVIYSLSALNIENRQPLSNDTLLISNNYFGK